MYQLALLQGLVASLLMSYLYLSQNYLWSWIWGHMSIIPELLEAEAGESQVLALLGYHGNSERPCVKKLKMLET